jgi:hypothetical protein
MTDVTDPGREQQLAQWAVQQTDARTLIRAYEQWYRWADAIEWAAGDAILTQLGECGGESAEVTNFLMYQICHSGQSKAAIYLRQSALTALEKLVDQGDKLAVAAHQKLTENIQKAARIKYINAEASRLGISSLERSTMCLDELDRHISNLQRMSK